MCANLLLKKKIKPHFYENYVDLVPCWLDFFFPPMIYIIDEK